MASSGRYQSRLFNFVRQQSLRLTEQCDRTFRHLQVSVNWGMQLVLYPVYVLFKSKPAPGKQFDKTVQQTWAQLQDANLAEEFSQKLHPDDTNSQPQRTPTADTPICGEPLRGMSSPLEYGSYSYPPLTFVDRSIADLESKYLAPVSKTAITLVQRSWELVLRAQTQLISLFGGTESAHNKSPTNVTDAYTLRIQALIWAAVNYFFGRRSEKQLGQTTPINNLELQAGSARRGLLPRKIISSKVPSAQLPPQLTSFDVDPWLTLNDLFGEPELEGEPSTQHISGLSNQTMSQIAGSTNSVCSSKLSGYSVWSNRIYLQRLSQLKQAFGLVKRQTIKGMAVAGKSTSPGDSNQPSTQLKPAPGWIETNATMMGYAKHPLEQLLDWLDRVMLYLEDFSIVVWRWIQQLLRAINPS